MIPRRQTVSRRKPPDMRRVLGALPGGPHSAHAKPTRASRTLWVRIGLAALVEIHKAFGVRSRGGTDASGLSWPPLAEATIKRKGHSLILIQTKALEASLRPGARPDDAGPTPPQVDNQIFRPGENSVTVGSSLPYAPYHHNGVPGRLPARPLWSETSRWPSSWWSSLLEQARAGIIEILKEELGK